MKKARLQYKSSILKRSSKMPNNKARNTAGVKTANLLKNVTFDEEAARDALQLVKERNLRIVDLKFNDLPGLWHIDRPYAIPIPYLQQGLLFDIGLL
jgi:uncharacterized protein (UPF0262 family)